MRIYAEERKFYEETDPEGIDKLMEFRFFNKVKKTNSCWNWIGKKNRKGYGVYQFKPLWGNQSFLAHRYSWLLAARELPEGKFVLHSCDNPACVNPDHLFLGSLQDNNQDMMIKKRHTWGIRHPQAKLNPFKVIQIRSLYQYGLSTQGQIADMYGIGRKAVSKICTGSRWKEV